jgi:hypothetical protein
MIRNRNFLPTYRLLMRAVALLAALIPSFASAQSSPPFTFTIVGESGDRTSGDLNGFTIGGGGEPPAAALLLPAVQAAREAARRLEKSFCDNEKLSNVTIETVSNSHAANYLKFELEDARVTSYLFSTGGDSASDHNSPVEEIVINYEEATVTYGDTGETLTFDCRDGTCSQCPNNSQ